MSVTNTEIKIVTGSDILLKENETLIVNRSAKTGAGSISIERQKTWVDRYMKNNANATRNGAKREYLKYRVEHAKEFTARIAQKMIAGDLLVNRASLSKSNAVRGVSFLTPRDASTVKVAAAGYEFGKVHGLTQAQVEEIVRLSKAQKKEEADATINVPATEVHAPVEGAAVAAAA